MRVDGPPVEENTIASQRLKRGTACSSGCLARDVTNGDDNFKAIKPQLLEAELCE